MHSLTNTRRRRTVRLSALITVLALVLAACGGDDAPAPEPEPEAEAPATEDAPAEDDADDAPVSAALAEPTSATLILDFLPSAVHVGIFYALEQGYYDDNNLQLDIIEPTSTSDTLRLIDSGEADFGIAEAVAIGLEIDEGRDAQVIMSLIQVPALALIYLESTGLSSPADLAGGSVSWPGSPNGIAIIDAMLSASGIDPEEVERTSIGFAGANSIVEGNVDAFLGTWASNAAQAEFAAGEPVGTFRFEDVIGGTFPGLVFFSTTGRIEADPDVMLAFVDATVRGYEDALAAPEEALDILLDRNPALERELQQIVFDNYRPVFVGDAPQFGAIQWDGIETLVDFLSDSGAVSEPIAPERYATDEFVNR